MIVLKKNGALTAESSTSAFVLKKKPTKRGECRMRHCTNLELYPGREYCYSCRQPGSVIAVED